MGSGDGSVDFPIDIVEIGTGFTGLPEDMVGVAGVVAGQFEDDGALKAALFEGPDELGPIDGAVSRGEVGVPVAAVVIGVEHGQVAGEFLHDVGEVAREVGVTGIEASADIGIIDGSEHVEDIAGVAEEEVGEHVFEGEVEAAFAAALGDAVKRSGAVGHADVAFFRGRAGFFFGAGMDDEVADPEPSGGFGGLEEFVDGAVAIVGIESGDVDVVGEGGVKGEGFESEVTDEPGGGIGLVEVVVIEVHGGGADFDHVKAAIADIFEHIEDARLVKAAGGDSDGPIAHGCGEGD